MTDAPDHEVRLTALEHRVDAIGRTAEQARVDASDARLLAAARDRDVADITVKVNALQSTFNAFAGQTAARFERLERKVDAGFARVDARFVQVDARFAQMNEGFARVDAAFTQVDANFAKVETEFAKVAVGQQMIVDLITRALPDDQR